jgi:uncharacterized repeat protein (TIGR03803 family)
MFNATICNNTMCNKMCSRISVGMMVWSAILTTILFVPATPAAAQQERVLHSFNYNGHDGYNPDAGLVIDAMGNLYGTTFNGGAGSCVNGNGAVIGCGTAFELMPNSEGGYSEKILHSFNYNGRDGYNPLAGLILDVAGNLYGTTLLGGSGTCSDGNGVVIGCGAVFELTPAANGCWSEQILHSFHNNGTDGVGPYSGVVFDAAGNLYGTTIGGGIYAYGTVYELTPRTGGGWRQMILHNFEDADGQEPRGGVILDGLGNLYGTTLHGGTFFNGVAFELSPQTDGPWTEIVLHSFGGSGDGFIPDSGPIFDQAGNLDGTTDLGGAFGLGGTAFELTPAAGGSWTETVMYSFGNGTDGCCPLAGLTLDASGNLYGTTLGGGTAGFGTAFELTAAGGGVWNETQLHSFGEGEDGSVPDGGLIFDTSGNLYGTTDSGGTYGYGTVFEIVP